MRKEALYIEQILIQGVEKPHSTSHLLCTKKSAVYLYEREAQFN